MPAIPAMAAVWEPLGKAYSAIVGGKPPEADHDSRRQHHQRSHRRRRLTGPHRRHT